MKKEEVNKQIKEVVRPNGKGEINGNNLQETLLLMNNNAANDEDTTSKLNLKANQKETDEKLALKADKTSVYTKEEANALLDLKVNIKDYEADKEVSSKEKQELDIKLAQTKQELDSVKNSLSHMGNGVVGEAKGGSVINLPNNAMKSVVPNYRIEGLTLTSFWSSDFKNGIGDTYTLRSGDTIENINGGGIKVTTSNVFGGIETKKSIQVPAGDTIYLVIKLGKTDKGWYPALPGSVGFEYLEEGFNSYITVAAERDEYWGGIRGDDTAIEKSIEIYSVYYLNITQIFGAGNEPSKEWCDKYLPDYVEGTKSVQLPMRVKSTGANLFDMSAFGWKSDKETKVKQISDTELEVWNDDFYSWASTSKPIKNLKEGNKYYVFMRMKLISEKGTVNAFLYTDSERVTLSSYKFIEFVAGKNNSLRLGATDRENVGKARFSDIIISDDKNTFERYKESNLYLNNNIELKSIGEVSDYIENGKLYKNISDNGEILEETEVVNLSTSGLIEANPNGTVFFEPITNITGFYDNGLDVEGLDILEVEEFSHLINGVYQSLDVSKVKVEGGKLTHPDAQNGIVYLVYRYDDNAVWGENTISYYNSDKTLKSPNGKIWKKVESATDTGELVVTLEEVNIVEP